METIPTIWVLILFLYTGFEPSPPIHVDRNTFPVVMPQTYSTPNQCEVDGNAAQKESIYKVRDFICVAQKVRSR